MADREKVVKGLEMCIADEYCNGCPYEVQCYSPGQEYAESMMRDALELLKEQPEIVRCKDCEYYRGGVLSGYCDRWFRQTGGEETYCSEGRQVVKQK